MILVFLALFRLTRRWLDDELILWEGRLLGVFVLVAAYFVLVENVHRLYLRESREAARLGLQKLPRNASPVRVRGRDSIDGRPRGFLSQFGVSRVRFRDMAHRGELPGITKSSW